MFARVSSAAMRGSQARNVFARAARRTNNGKKSSSNSWFSTGVLGGLYLGSAAATVAYCSEELLHAPTYDWSHRGFNKIYDAAALRRGYEVYRQVCATCHSMDLICFRNLVGHTHTEEQAKTIANSYMIMDGPNDKGQMFERPGKLSDPLIAPYDNEEQARMVNGGALPPDLSCIAKARHGGEDYIFALLTGYRPAPAGVHLRDGLHYNLYFNGGAISMAQALSDGLVEYEDDTPATASQYAKDVSVFLAWASEPEHDERHKAGCQTIMLMAIAAGFAGWHKRMKFSILKNRKIWYV